MKILIELSHVLLLQDPIPVRRKQDYETVSEYLKPLSYTIVSKDRKQVWSLMLVKFLGGEMFLLNGRGDGFATPLDGALFVNGLLSQELAASA